MRQHYEPLNRYILRTPVFSFTQALYPTEKEIIKLCSHKHFLEAIYLASPNVYEKIERYRNSNLKNDKDFVLTLLKYLVRMSARSTPFGLFSGVSVGHIENKNNIKINPYNCHQSNSRLDMDYLCSLVSTLEKDNNVKESLLYFPNTSLYHLGNKLRYIEYRYQNGIRRHHIASLEPNDYLNRIIKASNQGCTIKELSQLLEDDEISFNDAQGYIYDLIENQVLISSISPPVIGDDYLSIISKNITKSSFKTTISKIENEIKKIDQLPNDGRIEQFNKLKNLAKETKINSHERHLIQIDLNISTSNNTLEPNISNIVKSGVRVLNLIKKHSENPDLKDFKDRFYRRYEEEMIPLTLALDVEVGVGYGKNKEAFRNNMCDLTNDLLILYDNNQSTNVKVSTFDHIIMPKVLDCIKDKNLEICITDSDISNLSEKWSDLPNTFSVMTSVLASNDTNSEVLISYVGRNTAASFISRFGHTNSEISDYIMEITEKDHIENSISAEIAHLPESRVGNILYRPHLREYEIPFLAKSNKNLDKQISIDDLMVTVRDNKITLFSKKHQKEVIPYLTNMHNYWSDQLPIYNFLADLRSQNIREDLTFTWGQIFNQFDFLPRVKYKNSILSLAQWVISKSEIKKLESIKDIQALRKSRNIPSKVYIAEGDHKLLVNFENELSCRMFIHQTKKKNRVLLKEFLFSETNSLVNQEASPFVNEIIFSFSK